MTILAVTGLAREAAIAAGDGVRTVVGGGDCARLAQRLEAAIDDSVAGIVSFGIAGALDSECKPGDCIAASAVIAGDDWFAPDPVWITRIVVRIPDVVRAPIAGVDAILIGASAKAACFRATHASAADMESHIVARVAARSGIPFAVLRTIADRAGSELPEAAAIALTDDGRVNYRAVCASVLRKPGQIPALIRTGREANAAFYSLFRCRRALGLRLAGPDGR